MLILLILPNLDFLLSCIFINWTKHLYIGFTYAYSKTKLFDKLGIPLEFRAHESFIKVRLIEIRNIVIQYYSIYSIYSTIIK